MDFVEQEVPKLNSKTLREPFLLKAILVREHLCGLKYNRGILSRFEHMCKFLRACFTFLRLIPLSNANSVNQSREHRTELPIHGESTVNKRNLLIKFQRS